MPITARDTYQDSPSHCDQSFIRERAYLWRHWQVRSNYVCPESSPHSQHEHKTAERHLQIGCVGQAALCLTSLVGIRDSFWQTPHAFVYRGVRWATAVQRWWSYSYSTHRRRWWNPLQKHDIQPKSCASPVPHSRQQSSIQSALSTAQFIIYILQKLMSTTSC